MNKDSGPVPRPRSAITYFVKDAGISMAQGIIEMGSTVLRLSGKCRL
jgi:hypothetical protein